MIPIVPTSILLDASVSGRGHNDLTPMVKVFARIGELFTRRGDASEAQCAVSQRHEFTTAV